MVIIMKIMGIDYGKARIGFAACDQLGFLASPLCTLNEKHFPTQVLKTIEIINNYNPEKIILGFPKNMNGSISQSAELVKEFKEKIEKEISAEIIFRDERLTTVFAHNMLSDANVKGSEKRKKIIDAASAVIILQGYLDENKKK